MIDVPMEEDAVPMEAGEERVIQWDAVRTHVPDFVAEAYSQMPEGTRKD